MSLTALFPLAQNPVQNHALHLAVTCAQELTMQPQTGRGVLSLTFTGPGQDTEGDPHRIGLNI